MYFTYNYKPTFAPFCMLQKFLSHNQSDKNMCVAMAGMAQWIEHQTAKQRITGSIPSQGTCLGCGPGP